ncbi:hypothetical protein F5144DRAFT_615225 [Chaetomium tenue]|uniref:Uncharacterized protein n=1 Tax=Chaetomium tenue TaxID=1854479 RepID=A0ACB7P351_9PEZI|nr:hypothetical protein F5144DRAFT_615225 [Chaetomium globosum]
MSARTTKAPPPRPSPLFGVRIEVYLKVKANFEAFTTHLQRTSPDGLPGYWRAWDFDLGNDTTDVKARRTQRDQLKSIVIAAIDHVIGPDHGWSCEYEGSLKEKLLRLDNPRKWWGVKIISPPMSASKQWQLEIDMAFTGLDKFFDFYTDDSCGCHVHVSPGPTMQNGYTLDQLVRMAQGAFFWENGLCELLPPKRRTNEHARPNYTAFATSVYQAVPRTGWGQVFNEIESAANSRLPQPDLLKALQRGPNTTRNLSTDFSPVDKIGAIALRRQAGTASAITTIHRILLAVTLHISALRYDFDSVRDRKDYTTGEELIKELAGCIKKLPETCHGSRFVAFLKWSLESYADGKSYTTQEINAREEALHQGKTPPAQTSHRPAPGLSSSSQTPPAATARASATSGTATSGPQGRQGQGQTPTRAPAATSTPARRGGGAAGGGQSTSTTSTTATRNPAPQAGGGGRGGGGPTASTTPARTSGGGGGGGRGGNTQGSTSAARGGGGGATTRLPERPAAAASSTARTAGGSNSTATASTTNATTTPAAGGGGGGRQREGGRETSPVRRPVARRRQGGAEG